MKQTDTLSACVACAIALAHAALADPSPKPVPPPSLAPSTIISGSEASPALTIEPAPGGAVYLPTAKDKSVIYDLLHYAPVRRAGDFVYLSGVIAGPLPGEGHDVEALRKQVRRSFDTIVRNLAAAGATPADIVEIDSYHVTGGPGFAGDLEAELSALNVIDDYVKRPYPTWNVFRIAGLFERDGVIEFKVTAYAPLKKTDAARP